MDLPGPSSAVPAEVPNQPCQPGRDFVFPNKSFGKSVVKQYSFQAKWFETWKWLHWDDGKKGVLCHVCAQAMQSGKLTFSKNVEASFITKGFQNWKDATRLFRAHEMSKCHVEAVQKIVRLPTTTPDVGEMLVGQLVEDKKRNRDMLLHILGSVQLLARQGLALRGHGSDGGESDGATRSESVYVSEPNSNLHQLLKFVSGLDDRLSGWLCRKTNKYTSADIVNEMVKTMALTVLRGIASSIRGRKFTIMVDETTDSSTKEQCVICLRWVHHDLVPHEDLIGLHDTPAANAANPHYS